MILFRQRYPRWWFDFALQVSRFVTRGGAIPHIIVLAFLTLGAVIAVVAAWFAILFTGRYPRSLFDYVVGVGRWALRVQAYATLLVTDHYPPFRLS